MELPTYTSIWKIEKRLYKLYDFRLPMPLPVGQVAAFLAFAVPYMLILTMAGLPFRHSLLWLYLLPPSVLGWLVTRPVLEGKRLPELVLSQVRYLSEPRIWCRMAPLTEKEGITVVAKVWRRPAATEDERPTTQTGPADVRGPASARAERVAAQPERAAAAENAERTADPAVPHATPKLTVKTRGADAGPLPLIERALRTAPTARPGGWQEHVVLVPGGHRPGRSDHVQRDRLRAQLPLSAPVRIVVLGCTPGAGQTVTTLLTGQRLCNLRGEAVAVLDLAPRPGSLTEQARAIPGLLPSYEHAARLVKASRPQSSRQRGLQVLAADAHADQPNDAADLIDAVADRYPLMLADPAGGQVSRALQVADQLVLVALANADTAGALAMTLEWLDANDHTDLSRTAVTVLNGVSDRTRGPDLEKAATVATGRCRAIVRVPWDDGLNRRTSLSPAMLHAFSAVAGLLVSGLADRGLCRPASTTPPEPGI